MRDVETETIEIKSIALDGTETITEVEISTYLDNTDKNKFKGEWDTCTVCNYSCPKSEMGYIDGKPFCYKYNCYQSRIFELNRNLE
jgi:hypothetical protein